MKINICEIPNSGIINLMHQVQEAVLQGYRLPENHSEIFVMTNPGLLQIDFEMQSLPDGGSLADLSTEPVVAEGYFEDGVVEIEPGVPVFEDNYIIELLEAAEKHKDLKAIAEKYGLEVKSNLRNPKALKKDLIEQLEDK